MWDPLLACWMLRCPEQEQSTAVALNDFRRVERLDGPKRPPVHRVRYQCGCGEQHTALMTESELDWDPVRTPPPTHYDLQLGRQSWAASDFEERWIQALRHGQWPLRLPCRHEQATHPGWPSLLRAIEPDAQENLLVTYRCSACERIDCWLMRSGQLVFTPQLASR